MLFSNIKWLNGITPLLILVLFSCLSASFAYAYEDFSNATINSPDDIWDLVNDGEISYGYAQLLLELYDNPILITPDAKEDIESLCSGCFSQHLTIEGLIDKDTLETIKPFLSQQQGQDNSLRLTYSSYQQGQTSESLKIAINPKTQVYLWNKDTHEDSLAKYCLEFYDCAVGYYFLRFGEGLVLNNGSRQNGEGAFHDTLWKKSKVMRGAFVTKPFDKGLSQNKCVTSRLSIRSSSKACSLRHSELCLKEHNAAGRDEAATECNSYFVTDPKLQTGIFFSDIPSQPYTLSLKGFDKERLVGCHTKWQTRRLSVGYTGYASKLEGATPTTYSVMGPYMMIDMPTFQLSGESAWYHATTTGYGWIIKLEKSKKAYDITCSVYDFDKNFCTPYGHISGIEKMQDTAGGSASISRFFKGKLSTVRASYNYSKGNNDRLKIMACYNPSKKIRTKWWMEVAPLAEAEDKKITHTGKILWNITPDLSSTVGLRHEKNDGRDGGYTFLESTYTLWHTMNIKARLKCQNNIVGKDYTEYSLQLVHQMRKQHMRFIGKYTVKEYKDHTNDCRTNIEIKTVW